jgi:hypothetical protein
LVSTRSAGMTATLDDDDDDENNNNDNDVSQAGTEPAKRRKLPIGGCHEMVAQGRATKRPLGVDWHTG